MLPAQALTISPVKMEISGDPGSTLQGELLLFNEQSETKTFYSSSENFEARGETGAPFFLSERKGLATWIKTDAEVTLNPQEEKTIPFSIAIPKDAEPGGYFAAILWGQTPPEAIGGGQVAVGGRLGVLMLLRVAGEVEESGGLLEFGVKDKQKFFSSLPVTFSYRFNNTGGDRVVPRGEITVKNLFGRTSATLLVNKKEGSVLPGSARKYEVKWESEQQAASDEQQDAEKLSASILGVAGKQWSEFHFGWYTAKLNVAWGATNQAVTAKHSFFIIPWQLLLIIFVILAIIGFSGKIGLKKYNRWIIAKATQQPLGSAPLHDEGQGSREQEQGGQNKEEKKE